MTVGSNIKKLRTSQELTQEQLANRLYVTRQTVSSWEVGKSRPDLELLESIAEALGTNVMVLLYGPEPKRFITKKRIHLAIIFAGLSVALFIAIILIAPSVGDYYRSAYNPVIASIWLYALKPLCVASVAVFLCSLAGLRWNISLLLRGRRICLIFGIVLLVSYILLFIFSATGRYWLPDVIFRASSKTLYRLIARQFYLVIAAACGILGYLVFSVPEKA